MKTPDIAPGGTASDSLLRILVVDDDPAVREINTTVLTREKYIVDSAEDGAAAWDALQSSNYDLLITDNNMPNLSGIGLLKKLQAVGLDMPVVMATGTVPEEASRLSARFQPVATLLKPYTCEQLIGAVNKVLRPTSAVNPL